MYQVSLKPSAEKSLAKLPTKDQQRVRLALIGLQKDPYGGKKLQGEYKGYWSIRVWPYRIIYTIMKQELIVIVVAIGHRQGVYR
ncbi:MAG: type II toxin-antitoxin system RelE/ParE family toxin [Candidatus Kerfeldbacteria bacterium]|nr:type II toxin-antitoxin system RelE/ParE family toxin [Candidatus Kerfeldbacteria bacterium]